VAKFLSVFPIIFGKVGESIFSVFCNERITDSNDHLRQFFLQVSLWINLVMGVCVFTQAMFFGEIIHYFSAGHFMALQGFPIFLVIAAYIWSGAVYLPASNLLSANGYFKFQSVAGLIAAVVNITLSIIFVKWLGVIGAALGTLIAQISLQQGFIVPKACRLLAMSYGDYLRKVYLRILPILALQLLLLYLIKNFFPLTPFLFVNLFIALAMSALFAFIQWLLWVASASEKKVISRFLETVSLRLKLKNTSLKSDIL